MNAPAPQTSPADESTSAPAQPLTYTLEPLRSDGPDALAPEPSEGILTVRLRQIELSWNDDAFKKTITISSEDIFNSATEESNDEDPIPRGPNLTHATIEFLFIGSPSPHAVEIAPPRTLKCQCPNDTRRVKNFLSKHHFIQLAQPRHTIPLLLLLTALGAPPPNPTSIDIDDDDEHRSRYSALARPAT
ncbi:MAG TPA: hypothetical protein VJA21_03555 [Verrucomicrobiae bacterium]